jgi:hypothetical protein
MFYLKQLLSEFYHKDFLDRVFLYNTNRNTMFLQFQNLWNGYVPESVNYSTICMNFVMRLE